MICVACHKTMRVDTVGVMVLHPNGKYRSGDRYECPACKRRVIAGLSQDDFELKNPVPGRLLEVVE